MFTKVSDHRWSMPTIQKNTTVYYTRTQSIVGWLFCGAVEWSVRNPLEGEAKSCLSTWNLTLRSIREYSVCLNDLKLLQLSKESLQLMYSFVNSMFCWRLYGIQPFNIEGETSSMSLSTYQSSIDHARSALYISHGRISSEKKQKKSHASDNGMMIVLFYTHAL